MAKFSASELEELKTTKAKLMADFIDAQPPKAGGEDLLKLWDELYDETVRSAVVKTVTGPSDDEENLVFPYEKIQAIVGDGGNWKWPRMWQKFDEIERRGTAYREGEALHFGAVNKNPNIVPQRVLIVGGGPIGIRMSIELALGGHSVTVVEKRREVRSDEGKLESLGFTNRINRPHMWLFVRNDLAKFNGKEFMNRAAAYPVFTEPETSSIGIDELQCLLLKCALLLGVDFRLGVGYTNASIKIDEQSMMPSWQVKFKYDSQAAEKFGMNVGENVDEFDCLVGCDGPRSAVRDTQGKYFGDIEKRKFMDAVGIVANVRKLSRKRLKELGFQNGIEPSDMNRGRMVFKDFFKTIQKEADAEIENLIYYKASNHNYCIITPKRADLVKHGLSGKVYSFHEGREGKGQNEEEKAKLKAYCTKILKAASIPVDENEDNAGFVDAPNDCMAFDFAECWNTKKSLVFGLPSPGYDTETDGAWEGQRLVPLVCLAGDALLEPFWPMGLGLKRGWQAIMDTCYAIDNLYNRTLLCERKGGDPETFSWEEHYDALKEQCAVNFELCSRLQVSESLIKGEFEEKGQIMSQLKKKFKESEMPKPVPEVEIDPWTRYQPLEKELGTAWKSMKTASGEELLHPRVQKIINQQIYYMEHRGKKGEIDYEGKDLVSIMGQVVGGWKQLGTRKNSMPAPDGDATPSGGRKSFGSTPGTKPAGSGVGKFPKASPAGGDKSPAEMMAAAMFGGKGGPKGSAAPGGLGALMFGAGKSALPKRVESEHYDYKKVEVPAPLDVSSMTAEEKETYLAHVQTAVKHLTERLEQYQEAERQLA